MAKEEYSFTLNRIQSVIERESEALSSTDTETFSPTKTRLSSSLNPENPYSDITCKLISAFGETDPDTKLDRLYNKLKLKNNRL